MAQSSSNPNLGPLPGHDRYAQNEELSIRALRDALPVDRFVYRDERTNDEGIDGSIELLSTMSSLFCKFCGCLSVCRFGRLVG